MISAIVFTSISLCATAEPSRTAETYTISFASFAPLNPDVFIADPDGNNARPLFAHPDFDYDAVFAPGGEWIYFTSRRDGSDDIYRGRIDGSAIERVTDDPAYDDQAAISPDGKKLAFVSSRSGQADIWILDLKSKALHNATQNPAGDYRPAWSPDGKWLAFSSERDFTQTAGHGGFEVYRSTEIYVMRPNGKNVRRLTQLNGFSGSPRWSRDGKKIVFSHATTAEYSDIAAARRLPGTSHIKTIDVATGAITTLTDTPGEKRSPQFLAGDHIAYAIEGTDSGLEFVGAAGGA